MPNVIDLGRYLKKRPADEWAERLDLKDAALYFLLQNAGGSLHMSKDYLRQAWEAHGKWAIVGVEAPDGGIILAAQAQGPQVTPEEQQAAILPDELQPA
jgi:hypothetical protein